MVTNLSNALLCSTEWIRPSLWHRWHLQRCGCPHYLTEVKYSLCRSGCDWMLLVEIVEIAEIFWRLRCYNFEHSVTVKLCEELTTLNKGKSHMCWQGVCNVECSFKIIHWLSRVTLFVVCRPSLWLILRNPSKITIICHSWMNVWAC